jgi:ribonuclease-3 family protein
MHSALLRTCSLRAQSFPHSGIHRSIDSNLYTHLNERRNASVRCANRAEGQGTDTSSDVDSVPQLETLPPPLDLEGRQVRRSWNASSLAFLGDSVWELYVRRLHFSPPTHASRYRQAVIRNVRAESQSQAFSKLVDSGILNEEERNVLRWGKNASGTLPRRLSSDKVQRSVYREATAVECLVGYLYMSNERERLHELMEFLDLA